MKFYSTNNKSKKVSFKYATLKGMPNDKGLYMPEYIPNHSNIINGIEQLSIQDIGYIITESFVNEDLSNSQIEDILNESVTFDAPLIEIYKNKYILELFHGPTLAFKDFGASFMSRVMGKFVENNDKHLNILVATSGDTGSAVANGFYDVEGINVIILYPSKKISTIQEQQIATLDKNITALEIEGTFDDCQKLVKTAFLDSKLNSNILLSSANSINISRLIPQTFYYFFGYGQLKKNYPTVISVPSGNFGNLTAGLIAKFMGLPISKFIASTNANDIVPEFLKSGKFNPKKSIQTISNAMDVGDPSNIHRILDMYGSVESIKKDICSWSFDNNSTREQILSTLKDCEYLLDPHSAVGLLGLNNYINKINKNYNSIFLGTAHPAKFKDIIEPVIKNKIDIPEKLEKMMKKEKKSVYMKNNYEDFSNYLLSNFK